MRLITVLLSMCLTKLSINQIKTVLDEPTIDRRIKNTIMNPIFAFLFEIDGGLHNVRFYGPGISQPIEKTEKQPSSTDNRPVRIFTNDNPKEGDSIVDAAIRLFPSSAGVIAHTSSVKSNFGKYFIDELKKDKKILEDFAKLFSAIVNEDRKFNDESVASFTEKLKLGFVEPEVNPAKYKGVKKDRSELYILRKEGPIEFYRNYEKDLKLLLLNSFIITALDKEEDLKMYLEHVSNNVFKTESGYLSKEKQEINQSTDDIDKTIDKIVELYNSDLDFFPYSELHSPASNITIQGYDRYKKEYLERKSFNFSDCVETMLLNLCNCLFYDSVNRRYTLDHLKDSKYNVSKDLLNFYETHGKNGRFVITENVRNDWSKVVQDLPDDVQVDEIEKEADKFKTYVVPYVRHWEIDENTPNKHVIRNEIRSGFISMMIVLTKICGISRQDVFNGISEKDLASRLKTLFEMLSKKPNYESSIDVSLENLEEFSCNDRKDFAGNLKITFNYIIEKVEFKATVEIKVTSRSGIRHSELKFIPEKSTSNKDKIDAISKELKTDFLDENNLMRILIGKYLALASGKHFESENKLAKVFLSNQLYNNWNKFECLKRISKVIYEEETTKEATGMSTKISEELRSTAKLIMESLPLDDPGTMIMFAPFLIYIPDRLIEEKISNIIIHWRNALEFSNCKEIGYIWNMRIAEDDIASKIEFLDMSRMPDVYRDCQKTVEEVAKTIKKLKNLKILDISRCNINGNEMESIAEALKELTNLQKIDISDNEIGPDGAIALAEALKEHLNLQKINFSGNRIGPSGAIALVEALKEHPNLQELNLSDNEIGPNETTKLAKALKELKSLRKLNFFGNEIGPSGAIALAEALKEHPNLQELNFSENEIGDAGAIKLAEALKELANLQELYIDCNNIGDVGANAIKNAIEELIKKGMEESIKNPTQFKVLYILYGNYISENVKQEFNAFGNKNNVEVF